MSTDYHTPIATNAPANAAIVNAPLGTLDAAIGVLAAIPAANLCWDAFNVDSTPGYDWDEHPRWLTINATLANVAAPAAGNPWLGRNLVMTPVLASNAWGGKYIRLDDNGIQAGDVLSFGMLAASASTSYNICVRFHDGANFIGSFEFSAGTVGAGATVMQTTVLQGVTVPADATNCIFTAYSETTLDPIYIAAMWCQRGATANTVTPKSTLGAGHYGGEVAAAREGLPLLSDRMATVAPNLCWDAFNRDTTPNVDWDERTRWMALFCTLVNEDDFAGTHGNPWYGRNLLMTPIVDTGSYACKYIYLDEIGAQEGDVLSFGALAASAGGTYKVVTRFHDGSNFIGSFEFSSATTGAGATVMQTTTLAGVVVPATATNFLCGVYRESTFNPIYIAALWCTRSARASLWPMPTGGAGHYGGEVAQARGSLTTLAARLTVALNDDGTLKNVAQASTFDHYGRWFLRAWQGQIAKIQQLEATSQAIVALIGDSWTNRLHPILAPLLTATYGDAGPGFAHAGDTSAVGDQPTGVTRNVAGTWTQLDGSNSALARGVNLSHAQSVDEGATLDWTANVHAFVLHYIKLPNGGSFRYQVDAGGWTTIATANATEIFASVTVSGLDGGSHTFYVEVTVAGTAGVTICGVDCQETTNGVRVHLLADNGSASGHWYAVDGTLWEAGLTALDPTLCVIMLGVNDCYSTSVNDYAVNLAAIVTRCQSAAPLADILLVSPADADVVHIAPMVDYVTAARTLAIAEDLAHLDFLSNFGTLANADARGLYGGDDVHLTDAGYRQLANLLIVRMLAVT